ncbi:MAG: hypothetical protein Q4D62_05455 [Planctomycetia bacterium]|nr:hypothetical protein [Planctomycetia bacterium]
MPLSSRLPPAVGGRFRLVGGHIGEHFDGVRFALERVFVKDLVVFYVDLCAVVGTEFVEGGGDAHLEHVGE